MSDQLKDLQDCLPALCDDADLIAAVARKLNEDTAKAAYASAIIKQLCNRADVATALAALVDSFTGLGSNRIVDEDGAYVVDEDAAYLVDVA